MNATTAAVTVGTTTAAVASNNQTAMTADRFIFADANINATAVIDGGANRTGTAGSGLIGGGAGHIQNTDVLEVRNAAVVSLGDLAGIRNVSSLEFTNDTAVVQTSVLQLADATVDALVNSSLATVSTNTTTVTNSYEVLNVTGVDSPNVTGAFTQLNLDASLIVNAANIISVTGGGGADTIIGGAGADTILGGAGADVITGGLGNDEITGGAGADRITAGTGDTLIFATADVLVAAGVAGGTATSPALLLADIVTGPTVTGQTLLLNFADMGNTIAGATITQGTTVLMAGATANNFLVNQGTYNATTGVFTGTATTPTHTLITTDTNGTTADGVAYVLVVGVFATAVTLNEILTLTV